MNKILFLLSGLIFLFILGSGCSLYAQAPSKEETIGIPWNGDKGIMETVLEIVKREDVLPPRGPFKINPRREEFHLPKKTQNNPLAPAISQWPLRDATKTIDEIFSVTTPQTIGINFLGVQISETPGYVPPDCNGDVGPTQIVVHVNGRVKVFNKNGTPGAFDVLDNTFWQSVRNGADVTDPHVRYDRTSGRWFLVIINMPASGANRVLIAVSSGSTITSTSNFTFFQFKHDQVGTTPNSDTNAFADYPTLGVDANALYIGANIFNSTTYAFIGTSAYVVRKSDMLAGTLTVTAFRQLATTSSAGPFTPQGVQNDDPASTEGYFIGVDAIDFSTLVIRRVSNPGGMPTLSGNINLTVPVTVYPIKQPAQGSTTAIDAVDDRLFAAQLKKNRLTGTMSLWTAHNIEVNSSGVGGAGGGRNGSRWYEIINMNSTPSLRQSGTLYSSASTNPIGYWIPSVAMSGLGHMALGCSYAGPVNYAGVAVAGRLSGDALGTTQSPAIVQTSSTSYNADPDQRWGDYSQVVVDPADDMTMWTFQEYCNASNSWALRVVQLLAPPPATPTSVSPATVYVGAANVDVTLTGSSVSGSGFFDPGTGYTNRISATVNGGGVTVNNITYTSATSISLNLTIASDAAIGLRTITVTNPDGQNTTSATGILTINSSGCPTITLYPTILPDASLGISYNQTITASGGTPSYTYAITSGLLPNGLSLSSEGLLSGTATSAGTYNFSVTATDNNLCSGSQSYSLDVTGCPSITLSHVTLPNGTVGITYNQTITATGGTSPYLYAVTSGSPPAGLSLSSGGVLSGTPSSSGVSTFTITATDASNCIGNQAYLITISSGGGASIMLTTMGSPYTQDFNSLVSSGTSSTLPAGWEFAESGTNANTIYTATNGSANSGDSYSFGVTSSTERAFGGLQSGSLNPMIGANFTNNTGSMITSLSISYTGEQWRLGSTARVDRIDFQLSINATSLTSGTYVDYDNLDFLAPVTTGTIGALNGNAAINKIAISYTITGLTISNGATFFIRWNDLNASGADDGLGVDDFSITPTGASPTNPTVTAVATPSTVAAGNQTLLTATVTPGTNPVSTGISVAVDLSTIGGSAVQLMYDDGTHGDAIVGDNIFSYQATVALSTSPAILSLPVGVSDAQARIANTSITLAVTTPPCPTINLSPSSLPNGFRGMAYNQSVSALGGTPPYTFGVTTGTLPSGITLSSSGVLSGFPEANGVNNFTITANDSNGCVGDRAYTFDVLDLEVTVDIPIISKWNILSNPVITANDSANILFPNAVSRAYAYIGGSYRATDTLISGFGYWLKFNTANTVFVTGAPRMDDTIHVLSGWNMIGTLSKRISIVDVASIGTVIQSNFFGYNDGYSAVDSMIPGIGYWVKVSTDGELRLSSSTGIVSRNSRTSTDVELISSFDQLIFEDARQARRILYIGTKKEDHSPAESFDLPPIPPDGVFDVRFGSQRYAEVYSLTAGKSQSYPIKITSALSVLNIRWDLKQNNYVIFKLRIEESGTIARIVRMSESGNLKIKNPELAKLSLVVQNKNSIPVQFALEQNYPNPFNPTTTIRYQLPVESKVSLKIFNLLGEVVQDYGETIQEEGYHSVEWDAKRFASGIYFYKMDAFSVADSKTAYTYILKMLLVK